MAANSTDRLNIVICIKQVPDIAQVKIDPTSGTLRRATAAAMINPYDLHALAAALEIAKNIPGATTTALSMGPQSALTILKEAVALGIDNAILLQDKEFAGADTWATSLTLSAACRKLKADLIICGKQAIDGDTAQIGPGIAAHLGWAQACYVNKICETTSDQLELECQLDTGHERLAVPLPAVLTVVREIASVPYATLAGKIRARRYRPAIWGLNDLELGPGQTGLKGSFTRVQRISTPPPRKGTVFIEGATLEKKAQKLHTIITGLIKKGGN